MPTPGSLYRESWWYSRVNPEVAVRRDYGGVGRRLMDEMAEDMW